MCRDLGVRCTRGMPRWKGSLFRARCVGTIDDWEGHILEGLGSVLDSNCLLLCLCDTTRSFHPGPKLGSIQDLQPPTGEK